MGLLSIGLSRSGSRSGSEWVGGWSVPASVVVFVFLICCASLLNRSANDLSPTVSPWFDRHPPIINLQDTGDVTELATCDSKQNESNLAFHTHSILQHSTSLQTLQTLVPPLY